MCTLFRRLGLVMVVGLLAAVCLEAAEPMGAMTGVFPNAVRIYHFNTNATTVSNQNGTQADMTFKSGGGSALTTSVGRISGTRAVILEEASFSAPELSFPSNAFSVSVWIKPFAKGKRKSSNGLIVASGNGYYQGWRLLVNDWHTHKPALQLGKKEGAISLTADDALSFNYWNHLAATWDGARIRIYLNGMLSAEKPYAGEFVAAKGGLLLGFADYGVGSLNMAVDELAVFDRALTPLEVATLALEPVALSPALQELVLKAQELAVSADAQAAQQAYLCVSQHAQASEAWQAWGTLAATRFVKTLADKRQAAHVCAKIYSDEKTPEMLRGHATAYLAGICKQGYGAELPSRVLLHLPEHMALDVGEQQVFGLALARAYQREGNLAGATQVLKHLMETVADLPDEETNIRQQLAQIHWQAGEYDLAREQYAKILNDRRLPEAVRGLAALSVAQVWQAAGDLNKAVVAYQAVTGCVTTITYLLDEAEACAKSCIAQQAGKPTFDPEVSRERLRELPTPAMSYYVSTRGNDLNPGTFDKPFSTLMRARDAVRQQLKGGKLSAGGICVYVRGGRYTVTNTLELTAQDSGQFGAPIVYRAWRNERPVFDGGLRARGFWKVRDQATLARLPEVARGQVYVADLKKKGYTDFGPQAAYGRGETNQVVRELFQNGQALQIARWPNDDFLSMETVNETNNTFVCQTNRIARWRLADDLMADGYWLHLWSQSTVPLASVDATNGVFTFEKSVGRMRAKRPFFVLNLLEEIDRQGEWFLDRKNSKLYVWPIKHPWLSRLVLSAWDRPFIVARGVNGLVIQGLTFEYGRQHGIMLDGCVNTTIAGNCVRHLGGTALTVERAANVKIYGNVFQSLGHSGMLVDGGNRKNLTSGQIVIENNDVGYFSRCSRTYNPALLLNGCGARVAHNHFHHAPSSAMRIEGNDHLIEYNLVEHVVCESDDQGGIDMWGNPSYRGIMIRYNVWRDIGGQDAPCGQAGIRFDDAISGIVVYGNRFERTSTGNFGGVQIHGGNGNIIDNNIFTGCRYGVSFSAWGQKRWETYLARENMQNLIYKTVNISVPPYSKRYPELLKLPGQADINRVCRNVFVGTEVMLHKRPKGTEAWENLLVTEMPDLTALAGRSPFRPLPPQEGIGLYDDPQRAVTK